MEDRVIKLLEVATHPSTGDGERANAISMVRKLADRKGGIAALVGATSPKSGSQSLDDFNRMMEATRRAHRLERERDAAIVRLTKLQARLRTLAGDTDLDDPVVALYGALTGEWQTLGQIVAVARRNGFTGAENTLRKRADNLAVAGTIEVQAREPRSWRLKP